MNYSILVLVITYVKANQHICLTLEEMKAAKKDNDQNVRIKSANFEDAKRRFNL